MTYSTRVLVADDQVLVRAGIEALLAAMPAFVCVGAVADGQQCLAACAESVPDLLLLDMQMPGMDGLEVARQVRVRHPSVRIIILTAHVEAEIARQALGLGVLGFVSKDFVVEELALALQFAMAGRSYLSAEVAMGGMHSLAAPAAKVPALSPRQQEVLRGIARGRSNKLLARELGVSVKTVEYHRAELIQRLDLHDVASLTRFALAHGLAD